MKALEILKTHYCNAFVFTKSTRFSRVEYEEAISELEALKYNYEAQEIIIRDQTTLIEVMAQLKTCEGCEYDTDEGCVLYPTGLVCSRFGMIDRYEPKQPTKDQQ